MTSNNASDQGDANLRADYERTSQQINALADIRFKLLAFVPTVTTIATLLGTKVIPETAFVGEFLVFLRYSA